MFKICVVIPGYNAAQTIGAVIQGARKQNLDVLVIDDGSTDATVSVARGCGAVVLNNCFNSGKGFSLRRGFDYAVKNNYDAVIAMDSDGQHSPEDIPNFLKALESGADVVVGNRMFSRKKMPKLRWVVNKTMSAILSFICRQNIPDSQNGFRLLKCAAIKKFNLKADRFEIESELLVEAARTHFKIANIPVRSIYEGQKSRINPWSDTVRFLKFLFNILK